MSLDGFIAGPNDDVEQPLGDGGDRLHQWVYFTDKKPVKGSPAYQAEYGKSVFHFASHWPIVQKQTKVIE